MSPPSKNTRAAKRRMDEQRRRSEAVGDAPSREFLSTSDEDGDDAGTDGLAGGRTARGSGSGRQPREGARRDATTTTDASDPTNFSDGDPRDGNSHPRDDAQINAAPRASDAIPTNAASTSVTDVVDATIDIPGIVQGHRAMREVDEDPPVTSRTLARALEATESLMHQFAAQELRPDPRLAQPHHILPVDIRSLRDQCVDRGLDPTGTHDELQLRVAEHDSSTLDTEAGTQHGRRTQQADQGNATTEAAAVAWGAVSAIWEMVGARVARRVRAWRQEISRRGLGGWVAARLVRVAEWVGGHQV